MKAFGLKLLTLGLLFLFVLACKNFTCPTCDTMPQALRLKITDKKSSEDLIFNGTYKAEEISITYFKDQKEETIDIEIVTDTENESSMIISYEIPWKSLAGIKTYYLHLNSTKNETNTLYLNVVSKSGDCCESYKYVDFEINDEIIELDPADYIYNLQK